MAEQGRAEIPSWPRALVRGLASAVRRGVLHRDDDVDGSVRTVSIAFLSNLVVAVAKAVGFTLSGSSALLAETFHSIAVTANQGLLLRGHLTSRRPATREHPFGFGQVRYFWAFVVSVVIFGIGAVLSFGRGALALAGASEESLHPAIPLGALTVGLLMDGSSFVNAARQAREEKGDLSYREYVRRSKNPEVPVVLLEDSAAMVGLFFAYLGVGLAVLTGNAMYDAIASILIGGLLSTISFILAREMKSLLIGESANTDEEDEVRAVLTGHRAVTDLVYFRSLYLGPTELFVEAKLAFHDDMRFRDIAAAVDEMESELRRRVPVVKIVTLEPGVRETRDTEEPDYQRRE